MKRRRALALAGATVGWTAGCLSGAGSDSGEPSCAVSLPFDGDEPPEPTDGFELAIESSSLEESVSGGGDDHAGVLAGGQVLRHNGGGDPGRIELAVANRREDDRAFDMGATPPLSTYRGGHASADAGLFLVPTDRSSIAVEGERREESCAAVESVLVETEIEPCEFDPCGVHSREYDVFADANGDCLVPGEYRFRATWTEERGILDGEDVVWQFSIRLEPP